MHRILYLEEIYNCHKDIVQEIIKKMQYYGSEYIKCILEETGSLFKMKVNYIDYYMADMRSQTNLERDLYQNL